jgi:hypothetical protein
MARTFEIVTHNMLFRLNPEKWTEDLKKSAQGEITGYQEAEGDAARRTLKKFCAENGRGLYHPEECGNPISWNRATFTPTTFKGTGEVHRSAQGMGVNVKFNPKRDFCYLGLRTENSAGLVVNVHPVSGATDPTPEEAPATSRWKDWAIGQYWLDVVSFTAAQMSVQKATTGMEARWDWITVIGDYNAALSNTDQWYYPGKLLLALFNPDKQAKGLDHIVFSKGSDVSLGKRWTVEGNTDHRIHFQTVTTTAEKLDFPGKT